MSFRSSSIPRPLHPSSDRSSGHCLLPVTPCKNGFTLTLVLIVLAGLMILMVGVLPVSVSARKTTRSYTQNALLNLGLESGIADAFSSVSHAGKNNSFLTHQCQDGNGDPLYYLVSWFDPTSQQWHHQPLFSGAPLQRISPSQSDRYAPYIPYDPATDAGTDPIILKGLRMKESDPTEKVSFTAPRITIDTHADGEPRVSYAFWIEDLNGLLDYEAMTYQGSSPADSLEASLFLQDGTTPLLTTEERAGRYERKMLDQRHLSLSIFHTLSSSSPTSLALSQGEYPIDFAAPFQKRLDNPHLRSLIPAPPDNPFHPLLTETPSPPAYALSASTIESLICPSPAQADPPYSGFHNFFTYGLPNTLELELVPYGHAYPNAGTMLKANLNHYITRAEQAMQGGGISSLAPVVTDLAKVIENVRGFQSSDAEYAAVGITNAGGLGEVSHTRYGGLRRSESYTKTLAANIIDYADRDAHSTSSKRPPLTIKAEDNQPTDLDLDDSQSHYRGIDSMPLLTETARRYELVANFPLENGQVASVVEVRTFLELYNPTNQSIHGYVKYVFYPHLTHEVEVNGNLYTLENPDPAEAPHGEEALYYWNGLVTLQPNQYKVIEVKDDLNADFQGETGEDGYLYYQVDAPSHTIQIKRNSSRMLNYDRLYWYGVSAQGGTAPHTDEDFQEVCGFQTPYRISHAQIYADTDADGDGVPDPRKHNFSVVGPPMRYDDIIGDPRHTFYTYRTLKHGNYSHYNLSYSKNAGFGGQNHYALSPSRRQNYVGKFPDPAYNSSFGIAAPDASGATSALIPGELGYVTEAQALDTPYPTHPYPDHVPERYLQRISNAGRYFSLGELGNIYDPAQWKYLRRQTTHTQEHTQALRNDKADDADYTTQLQVGKKYISDAGKEHAYDDYGQEETQQHLGNFGGGITLAIGSPEFNAFDPHADPRYDPQLGGGREGYEAARLLDQFRVTDSEVRSLKGRINVNTAPKKVLQAVFSGFTYEADPVMGDFTFSPREKNDEPGGALVTGLINRRGEHPFTSLSSFALARDTVTLPGSDGILGTSDDQDAELSLFGEKALFQQRDLNADGTEEFNVEQEVWNDSGREELFCRTHDLFTMQSRSYRLHLQAEYTHGKAHRVARKTIDFTVHPQYVSNSELGTHYDIDPHQEPIIKIHKVHR